MLSGSTNFKRKQPYLMISEPNIPGVEHSQPITARRHVHTLGQLLQNWKMTGLEVVSQSHMKLLLMGLDMNIWTEGGKKEQCSLYILLTVMVLV